MAVRCRNCGNQLQDPGGTLEGKHCSICGSSNIERTQPEGPPASSIAAAAVGALLGAALSGGGGAFLGAFLGFIAGAAAKDKR